MADGDIMRVLSDLAWMGGKVIEFSGGEPLVHPKLKEFISAARTLGLESRLYSSGVVDFQAGAAVSPGASKWEDLREAGLQKVFFNLQADTAILHERITRIPGSFSSVIESFKAAKKVGLSVGVHFVPMAPNFRHMEETYRLACDLMVDEFAVLRLMPQGRAADNKASLSLTQHEFFEVLGGAMRLQRESTRVKVRLGCPLNHRLLLEPDSEVPSCRAGEEVCHIRPNGDVVPCSGFQHAGVVLGNVRLTSLAEAWNSGPNWARFRDDRSIGPVPGSVEFIRLTGDPCLAQLSAAREVGRPALIAKEGLRRDSGILVQ